MSDEGRRIIRMYIGAVAAGIIAMGAFLTGSIVVGKDIHYTVWILASCAGLTGMANHLLVAFSQPPQSWTIPRASAPQEPRL